MNSVNHSVPAITFENKRIRRHWNQQEEKWYFAVVDVVEALTKSPNSRSYWKVLKNRLKKEGSEVVTKCNQLKMQASDGNNFKSLKNENLRDNMTNLELVLNMLAEASTTEISQAKEPKTFSDNRKVARAGGGVAGKARQDIESRSGRKVISPQNHLDSLKERQLKS